MKTLRFNCYKVAKKLHLDKIAAYFEIHRGLTWKEYIEVKDFHLEMILKYQSIDKSVYLFKFGCITFVNFSPDEIRIFFQYMESIGVFIDQHLFMIYHQGHTVQVLENGNCDLLEGSGECLEYRDYIVHILSIILAKSTALNKVEDDLNVLMDDAEKFIELLQEAKLRPNTRSFASITARILRFEYESIDNIRLFDRSVYIGWRSQPKEIYERMSRYYELHERFEIIKSKVEDLTGITKAYSTSSYKQTENRLYLFEIFLLALFPIMHIVYKFME